MSTTPPDRQALRDRARFDLRLERWDPRPDRWRTPSASPPASAVPKPESDAQERLKYVRKARAALRKGARLPRDPLVASYGRRALLWLCLGFASLAGALWLLGWTD